MLRLILWKPSGTPEPFKDFLLLLLQQSGSSLFPRGNQIFTPKGLLYSVPNLARSEAKVDPDLLQMGVCRLRGPLSSPIPCHRRWRRGGVGGRERASRYGLEGTSPVSGGPQDNREASVDPGSTHMSCVDHRPLHLLLLLGRTEINPSLLGLFQKRTRK